MSIKFRDRTSLEYRLQLLLKEFAEQHEDGYTMLFVTPDTHVEVKVKKPTPNTLKGNALTLPILDEYYTDKEPIEQMLEIAEAFKVFEGTEFEGGAK